MTYIDWNWRLFLNASLEIITCHYEMIRKNPVMTAYYFHKRWHLFQRGALGRSEDSSSFDNIPYNWVFKKAKKLTQWNNHHHSQSPPAEDQADFWFHPCRTGWLCAENTSQPVFDLGVIIELFWQRWSASVQRKSGRLAYDLRHVALHCCEGILWWKFVKKMPHSVPLS